MTASPVEICARADAGFHQLAYQALNIRTRQANGLWWAERVASPVLLRAGTIEPWATDIPPVSEIRDSWGTLELGGAEWKAEPEDPWMLRDPAPLAGPAVPGLIIERVTEPESIVLFERAVINGVGRTPTGHVDGAIHPPATAEIRSLHLFIGRVDGRTVGTSLAAATPCGLSIGAIATVQAFRGRGIGAAMTAAAVSVAPSLPATLLASTLGYRIYQRLGFREVGRGIRWSRRN